MPAPPFIGTIRFGLVAFSVFLAFGLVFVRLLQLQVWEADAYASFAEKSRTRFVPMQAPRGPIMDASGNLLATTRTVIEVGVDPQLLTREDFSKIPEIASILRVDKETVQNAFERQNRKNPATGEVRPVRWVKLADAVSPEQYEELLELRVRAVYGNFKNERRYPASAMAAHLIGFVNREGTAVNGVERAMNFYLTGQDGWRESERDGRRRELAQFRDREVLPRRGLGVELTLDLVLQALVEKELDAIVSEYNPRSATIIVTNPRTGDILALANRPTYDLNQFWDYPVENHDNRALTTVYEPGSTFKIVPTAAALNESLVDVETIFDCSNDRVKYRGRMLRMPRDHQPFGEMSVEEIFVRSSNRGSALLGMKMGEDQLYRYARAFGFGETTGLNLGPESRGILHPVNRWDGLTITRMPMGHAISATPMQVHNATSILANDGIKMRPRLVQRIFDDQNQTVLAFPPRKERQVISPETAGIMASLSEKVVGPGGTARNAFLDGFRAAGKTGTTQMIINGRYSSRNHVASFTGFFPVDNPQAVITVVVEDPQVSGTGFGGRVAAPSFKNIAEAFVHHRGIPPSHPKPELLLVRD